MSLYKCDAINNLHAVGHPSFPDAKTYFTKNYYRNTLNVVRQKCFKSFEGLVSLRRKSGFLSTEQLDFIRIAEA